MFWRLNCLAAIPFALCCTSSTFWLGSATTDEQNKAPHVDHHKLTETQQYELFNSDGQLEELEQREHIIFAETLCADMEKYKEQQLNDGVFDWQDYRNLIYGKPHEGQEILPEYVKMIKRDERRWKSADCNSDGKMVRTEYGCFMHPEDSDHMRDIVVQDQMRDWVMPLNFDHADTEAKRLIHIADENKDGKLSSEEILNHYDTL